MEKGKVGIIICLGVCVFFSRPLWAEVVTLEMEGVVTDVLERDGLKFDGSVVVGTKMMGYCKYDLDTPNRSVHESYGIYELLEVSMTVGNYTFGHNPEATEPAWFQIDKVRDRRVMSRMQVRVTDPWFEGTVYVNGVAKTFEDLDWGAFGVGPVMLESSYYYLPLELPKPGLFPDLEVFDKRKLFFTKNDALIEGFHIV